MDGYEATKILKEKMNNNELKDIPIIAVTAFSTEEDKAKCYSYGFDEVLVKPYTLD